MMTSLDPNNHSRPPIHTSRLCEIAIGSLPKKASGGVGSGSLYFGGRSTNSPPPMISSGKPTQYSSTTVTASSTNRMEQATKSDQPEAVEALVDNCNVVQQVLGQQGDADRLYVTGAGRGHAAGVTTVDRQRGNPCWSCRC